MTENLINCFDASIWLPSPCSICKIKSLTIPWINLDTSVWIYNPWLILYAFTFKAEMWGLHLISIPTQFSLCGFHVYPALEEIPLCFVIIHVRLWGLQLFTSLMDSLIEVKWRHSCYRTILICEGKTENIKCWYQTEMDGSSFLCNDITGTLTLKRTQ